MSYQSREIANPDGVDHNEIAASSSSITREKISHFLVSSIVGAVSLLVETATLIDDGGFFTLQNTALWLFIINVAWEDGLFGKYALEAHGRLGILNGAWRLISGLAWISSGAENLTQHPGPPSSLIFVSAGYMLIEIVYRAISLNLTRRKCVRIWMWIFSYLVLTNLEVFYHTLAAAKVNQNSSALWVSLNLQLSFANFWLCLQVSKAIISESMGCLSFMHLGDLINWIFLFGHIMGERRDVYIYRRQNPFTAWLFLPGLISSELVYPAVEPYIAREGMGTTMHLVRPLGLVHHGFLRFLGAIIHGRTSSIIHDTRALHGSSEDGPEHLDQHTFDENSHHPMEIEGTSSDDTIINIVGESSDPSNDDTEQELPTGKSQPHPPLDRTDSRLSARSDRSSNAAIDIIDEDVTSEHGGSIHSRRLLGPSFNDTSQNQESPQGSITGESCSCVSWTWSLFGIGIEIVAAVLDQLSSPSKPRCALYALCLSFVALACCIGEFVNKAQRANVKWRRPGMLWWFYRPDGRSFGSLNNSIGFGCAIYQVISSIIQFAFFSRHVDNPVKLIAYPIIFYTFAAIGEFLKPGERAHAS